MGFTGETLRIWSLIDKAILRKGNGMIVDDVSDTDDSSVFEITYPHTNPEGLEGTYYIRLIFKKINVSVFTYSIEVQCKCKAPMLLSPLNMSLGKNIVCYDFESDLVRIINNSINLNSIIILSAIESLFKLEAKCPDVNLEMDTKLTTDISDKNCRIRSVREKTDKVNAPNFDWFFDDTPISFDFGDEKKEDSAISLTRDNAFLALDIGAILKTVVIGQDEYVERLALLVHEQIRNGSAKPLLVIGKSGSGKTHALKMLSDKCKDLLPDDYSYLYVDCSGLTEKGFVGSEVSDIFKGIKKGTKRGIVFLDEIDKIIKPSSNSKGENVNLPVQTEIMNYMSGKEIDVNGRKIDTSKFLFVLGGAFPDLYDLYEKKNSSFGFIAPESAVIDIGDQTHKSSKVESKVTSSRKGKTIKIVYNDNSRDEVTIRNDLVNIGASREFVGRIGSIITLNCLSREDLEKILDNCVIPETVRAIKEGYNIDVDFTSDAKTAIVEAATQNSYGARIINSTVSTIINRVLYEILKEAKRQSKKSVVSSISLEVGYKKQQFTYDVKLRSA